MFSRSLTLFLCILFFTLLCSRSTAQSDNAPQRFFYAEAENYHSRNHRLLKFGPGSVISIKMKNLQRIKGVISAINDSVIFVKTTPIKVSDIYVVWITHNPFTRPGVSTTSVGAISMVSGIAIMSSSNYPSVGGMLLAASGYCMTYIGSNLLIGALIWEIIQPGVKAKKGGRFYIQTETEN